MSQEASTTALTTAQSLKVLATVLLLLATGLIGFVWKATLDHGRASQDLQTWRGMIERDITTVRQLDKDAGQITYQVSETHKLLRELLDTLKAQQAELDKQTVQQVRFQVTLEEIRAQMGRRR